MTTVHIHRLYRNQLIVPGALVICFALLAVWEIVIIQSTRSGPMGAIILGATLGAMTGAGIIVRRRWRLYLASRT